MATTTELLVAFDAEIGRYRAFAVRVQALICDLLAEHGRNVHSVTFRVKDRESFERKIQRSGAFYESLSAITDVAGVRIITYFEDDVDALAQVIEREFEIDTANSVDKRAALDPDRFGYLSLHYVAALTEGRRRLTEYRKFPDMKCEIQIRSILQHAWAEIEHDLGYKSAAAIPRSFRRRFSRLAGLLETADTEFARIRDDLSAYEAAVPAEVAAAPNDVGLDKAALLAFAATDAVLKRVVRQIAAELRRPTRAGLTDDAADTFVSFLAYIGFSTIGGLAQALQQYEHSIIKFAVAWLDADKHLFIDASNALTFLLYTVLAAHGDRDRISDFLERFKIGLRQSRNELIEKIVGTYDVVADAG